MISAKAIKLWNYRMDMVIKKRGFEDKGTVDFCVAVSDAIQDKKKLKKLSKDFIELIS